MDELWLWVTTNFNNRELASAIWLTAILLISSAKKNVRASLASVFRALLVHRLMLLFFAFSLNVILLSWLGVFFSIWNSELLVATIVWGTLSGVPLLGRAFEVKEGTQHFRGYAKDALSGTTILEFIFVARTFSLSIELVLTPIITVIAMMIAISERDPKHEITYKLLTQLMAIVVMLVFWNSAYQVWSEPGDFFSANTFKNFILPIYLTIGSIPFFYAVHCYSSIESSLVRINLKAFQSDALKKYAKKRFILMFMVRPWLLRRAVRQFHTMPAREIQDVDKIICDIFDYERDVKLPPVVDETEGWSPYLAQVFLLDDGLGTGDYHASSDGKEWWSGVVSRDLDESVFTNQVNYSFFGTKGLVKRLKLKGHFLDEFVKEESLPEFSRLAVKLLTRAKVSGHETFLDKLVNCEEFEFSNDTGKVRLKHERFPNDRGFDLVLEANR